MMLLCFSWQCGSFSWFFHDAVVFDLNLVVLLRQPAVQGLGLAGQQTRLCLLGVLQWDLTFHNVQWDRAGVTAEPGGSQ